MSVVNKFGEIMDKDRRQPNDLYRSRYSSRSVLPRAISPISLEGDNALGKLLTILSILSVPSIMYLYYSQVPYTPGAGEHWELYVTLGSLLAIVFDAIGIGLLYFTFHGLYTVMGGYLFFDSLLNLQDNRVSIACVRLLLLPCSLIFACISNHFIATHIIFNTFNQLAWIVGPFLPLLMLTVIIFAAMLD